MEKKFVQVILTKQVWDDCRKKAKENGMTLAGFIKHLIAKDLKT